MLVHLVDLAPLEGEPAANYEAVRAELSSYGAGLDAAAGAGRALQA